jgi:hypothetical protein
MGRSTLFAGSADERLGDAAGPAHHLRGVGVGLGLEGLPPPYA